MNAFPECQWKTGTEYRWPILPERPSIREVRMHKPVTKAFTEFIRGRGRPEDHRTTLSILGEEGRRDIHIQDRELGERIERIPV